MFYQSTYLKDLCIVKILILINNYTSSKILLIFDSFKESTLINYPLSIHCLKTQCLIEITNEYKYFNIDLKLNSIYIKIINFGLNIVVFCGHFINSYNHRFIYKYY